jgi:hypothetical protein
MKRMEMFVRWSDDVVGDIYCICDGVGNTRNNFADIRASYKPHHRTWQVPDDDRGSILLVHLFYEFYLPTLEAILQYANQLV